MTAAQLDALAVKAARIAANSTGADADRWWTVADHYAARADRARQTEKD